MSKHKKRAQSNQIALGGAANNPDVTIQLNGHVYCVLQHTKSCSVSGTSFEFAAFRDSETEYYILMSTDTGDKDSEKDKYCNK